MFCKKYEEIFLRKTNMELELKILFDLLNDFYSDGFQPEETIFTRHSMTLIDSVYKNDKSHYPKVLLEYCKYIVKDKAIKTYNYRFI